MRASVKYHLLNNIKADLRDKRVAFAGDSPQTCLAAIHRIKERGEKKKTGKENCLYPTLVYHFYMTAHDSLFFFFCTVSQWAWYPKAAYMATRVSVFFFFQFLIAARVNRVQFNQSHFHNKQNSHENTGHKLCKLFISMWNSIQRADHKWRVLSLRFQ